MMSSAFERFYKTEVEVVKISCGGGYGAKKETEFLCTVKADLQPYSGALAEMEYGFNIKCQKRMFCLHCAHIREGNCAVVNNTYYRIVYVEEWDSGMMAFLEMISND